jgi:hypothetical protein
MTKENIDQVILVVRRFQVGDMKADYSVEKWATTLEDASRYKVSLETLNDNKNISYYLFNSFGVIYDVEQKSEEEDDRVSV